MYYNRVYKMWVADPIDYFILSVLLGSIFASSVKDYLSEKRAMERLKNSIIKKSKLVIDIDSIDIDSKNSFYTKEQLQKIYHVAIRGGEIEHFPVDQEVSKEAFKLAQGIKNFVERLALYLKQRELKGVARIFFRNGRLFLELILHRCKIDIIYALFPDGVSTQVIVVTTTLGTATGFILSWYKVGSVLLAPPVLISTFLLRSLAQQILNQRDFLKFKNLVNKMLQDDDIKDTLKAVFVENELPKSNGLEMKPWNSNKEPISNFKIDKEQTLDQFIKNRMKEELGLIENPSSEQIEQLIYDRKPKKKGKTVYFIDFIKQFDDDQNQDGIDSDVIDIDIIED